VIEKARAKVNLSLHVLGRRPDGYHELDSLVAFAGFGDDLEFSREAGGGAARLRVEGPFAGAIEGHNLIEAAADTVAGWFGRALPGQFTLTKHIPVAAGLGGGSADAAAAIRALARAFDLDLRAVPNLAEAAARIGADVPVCLHQTASWMRGIGEILRPLDRFPEIPAVLVNPRVPLSTRDVFRALSAPPLDPGRASPAAPNAFEDAEAVIRFLAHRSNDLEAPATRLAPVVGAVLSELRQDRDCALARLSGSGPTCFGLYLSSAQAASAALRLRASHPAWWVMPTALRGAAGTQPGASGPARSAAGQSISPPEA
jgi:4-diphosphocytidyl-2-C-methyl-D-erythritol kinase